MIVYLAGGFHGDWQTKVKEECPTLIFLDPKDKETKGRKLSLKEYTDWDLEAIRSSELVFVYYEKTNPGVGCLMELGYAYGLGKGVIFVQEPEHETIKDRYIDFGKGLCHIHCQSLEEGIEALKKQI